MEREETHYTCENCAARNTGFRCQVCGSVRKTGKLATSTNLLPAEPSLGGSGDQPESLLVDAISRHERKSIPEPPPETVTPHSPPLFQRVPRRIKTEKRGIIPLGILIAIILLSPIFIPQIINLFSSQRVPTIIGKDGIGVTLVDGEYIGISDGRYALDINLSSRDLMLEASESLRKGNLGPALAGWTSAHEKDTNNAEPLIYAENQRVLTSGDPYITVVLGVSLGEKVDDGFSRDALQGAYIVQKECNENPQLSGGKKLRLLIASSGSHPESSKDIAKQIVQAAQFDHTIVGVQGWTTSVTTLNALQTLVQAHLPVVAPNTASDNLTGISPYFFRIENPISKNIPLAVNYIEKQLAPQRLVIFRDPHEPYSLDASQSFAQKYKSDGYHIAATEDFQTGDEAALTQRVQSAFERYNPDLLYIPTSAVDDITTLLKTIPRTAEYANLKVLTGVEGYDLVQSEKGVPDGYTRMIFSSSAFPDEWKILGQGNQEPPFFNDYPAVYDPHNQHATDHPYTYRRANGGVMLDYDALRTFLEGIRITIQQGKQNPTPEDLKNALSQMKDFQGITGTISFGPDGNPINKLHFVLRVVDGGFLHVAAYQGCLLVSSECDNNIHILE